MGQKKRGLGKGLEAIFAENTTDQFEEITMIKINDIEPNRDQPRKEFDEESLAQLAESIMQYGVLQPILVKPVNDEIYQIVAGERRWRACRKAGISEIPAIIKELNETETTQIALIENLQRSDLTPIEEAKGYKNLMSQHGFTQEEISKLIGKSRPAITNVLRLLNLPEEVQKMVNQNRLSFGHARALLSIQEPKEIIKTAKLAMENEMSVRELEKMTQPKVKKQKKEKKVTKSRDSFYDEMEIALKESLGRKIKITCNTKKSGTIEIEFFDKHDLATIASRLAGTNY